MVSLALWAQGLSFQAASAWPLHMSVQHILTLVTESKWPKLKWDHAVVMAIPTAFPNVLLAYLPGWWPCRVKLYSPDASACLDHMLKKMTLKLARSIVDASQCLIDEVFFRCVFMFNFSCLCVFRQHSHWSKPTALELPTCYSTPICKCTRSRVSLPCILHFVLLLSPWLGTR